VCFPTNISQVLERVLVTFPGRVIVPVRRHCAVPPLPCPCPCGLIVGVVPCKGTLMCKWVEVSKLATNLSFGRVFLFSDGVPFFCPVGGLCLVFPLGDAGIHGKEPATMIDLSPSLKKGESGGRGLCVYPTNISRGPGVVFESWVLGRVVLWWRLGWYPPYGLVVGTPPNPSSEGPNA